MKKTYITPELNIVEVQNAIMAGSDTLGVDTSKGTTSQYSKRNTISFEDDDDVDLTGAW